MKKKAAYISLNINTQLKGFCTEVNTSVNKTITL